MGKREADRIAIQKAQAFRDRGDAVEKAARDKVRGRIDAAASEAAALIPRALAASERSGYPGVQAVTIEVKRLSKWKKKEVGGYPLDRVEFNVSEGAFKRQRFLLSDGRIALAGGNPESLRDIVEHTRSAEGFGKYEWLVTTDRATRNLESLVTALRDLVEQLGPTA